MKNKEIDEKISIKELKCKSNLSLINNDDLKLILSYVNSKPIFFNDKRLLNIDEINDYKEDLLIDIECIPLIDLYDNYYVIYNLNVNEFQIYDISEDIIVKKNITIKNYIEELIEVVDRNV